jgi:hypothetical protein
MKSKQKRFTPKLAAKVLGVCMATGLAVMGATSAQAVIYNPYSGYIPYTYVDSGSRGGATVTVPAFRVQANSNGRGWYDGFGTTGENRPLQNIRVTQLLSAPKLCLQTFVTTRGWQTEQCTNGLGTTIEVGELRPPSSILNPPPLVKIESVAIKLKDCTLPNSLTVRGYLQGNLGWQEPIQGLTCEQELMLGTQKGGLRLEALDIRMTDICTTC